LFDLVVKHILPGMGLFFYFVLHFNCKFAAHTKDSNISDRNNGIAYKKIYQINAEITASNELISPNNKKTS